jgi:repressor LexA
MIIIFNEERDKMSNLGNKKIMAKNIQRYMDIHNKTRKEMCEALGVKYTTFTDWVKGNTYPRIDKIELMANYFGIEKSDLIEDSPKIARSDNAKPITFEKHKGVRIPVLGYVAAGVPIDAIEEIIDWEEIPKEMAVRGEYFGLKIKGDSMAPDIKNKDVVIVRQQPDAENDEIVIVTINGDEGVCKKLKKSPEGITLISRNPAYEPMFFTPQEVTELPVAIVGKVIELRRSF